MISLLTRNLGWKLLSLAIAVLLWLAIVGEPEVATSISVPIQYKNIPRDLEVSSEVLDRVHLEVRGPSGKVSPSSLADTAIILDLGAVHQSGERTYTIRQDNVNLPSDVVFLRAVPAQIRLHFERRLSREVPVQVRHSEPPPPGYEVVSEIVRPDSLRIVGPESHIQEVESVQTDPIDLSQVVGATEFHVHTYVPNPQVRFEGSSVVTVSVEVQKVSQGEH
jgi:hypothetical protein